MSQMNSRKYLELAENIFAEAKHEVIALLKECGDKCFIAFDEWDDCCTAMSKNDVSVSIFAVGLDEKGELCVAATVDNVGYGYSEDDFVQGWTGTSDLYSNCYPELYRFVADNLDKVVTKAEADNIVSTMYE